MKHINYWSLHVPESERHTEGDNIDIYIDNFVFQAPPGAIILLVEPRSIVPDAYRHVENHWQEFSHVFSFDSKILEKCGNAKLFIYGTYTYKEDPPTFKTKEISMVCNNKTVCLMHIKRQQIAHKLKGIIDTYGRFDGGEFVPENIVYDGYMFNVAIENYSDGHYFTEKIVNCFVNYVVPIYWGCPKIGEYFNTDGIIIAKDPEDIPGIIDKILYLGPDRVYANRIEAIKDNYNRALKYHWYFSLFEEMYHDFLEAL